MNRHFFVVVATTLSFVIVNSNLQAQSKHRILSHPPMRPLPTVSHRPMNKGPAYFIDPKRGSDTENGSKQKPWKTLVHAVQQLKPGDTLYLRGGTYYEHVTVKCSGSEEEPITIRSYPGELAIIDGSLREFFEHPDKAWEPCANGARGEYRSTKKYPDLGGRPDQTNVLGNFGDSMVPLHGYRYLRDLRTDNMFFKPNIRKSTTEGIYCGPGLWYDTKTGYIHVRLAHTTLKGLHEDNYKGETDPRKVPLIVAGFKGGSPLAFEGAKNLVIQDLVVRGARAATIDIANCENLTFDGLTVYGGSAAFRIKDTWGLRIVNTACRGIAAPWTFRGSLKYRAIEARIFSASGWQPTGKDNRDFEIAYSEFTDSVDGVFIGNVRGVKFHHNLVDNISDDGIFLTAGTAYDGTTPGGDHYIYQNLLSRCLTTFAFGVGHGRQRAFNDGRQTGWGVVIYRNVFDFRRPVMYYQPSGPKAPQEITSKGRFASDHGGPTWEPMWIYHNTIIADQQRGYAYGALGLGDHMGGGAARSVFNNIVVQLSKSVGLYLPPPTSDFGADGNLLWSIEAGKTPAGNAATRKKFRRIVEESKSKYLPGWTTHDRFADPKFVQFDADWRRPIHLALQKNSPAINGGILLAKGFLDPLRDKDTGKPDQGALPYGAKPWHVGVRGRLNMFGENKPAKKITYSLSSYVPRAVTGRWSGKPVAIVEGYPAFDAPLLKFALRKQKIPVEVYEKQWLDPKDYNKYSMVVLVGSLARAKVKPAMYSKEHLQHVRRYLDQGGKLFIMRSGRGVLASPHGKDFLTAIAGKGKAAKNVTMKILLPDHLWVEHLRFAKTHPWLASRSQEPIATGKGQRIIGAPGGQTTLCQIPAGKGQFIYLGWEIANSLPSKKIHSIEKEAAYEEQMHILTTMVVHLFPKSYEKLPINKTKAPGPAPKGMVWIPGGWFWMGSDDPNHFPSHPIHKVYVDGLWMDKYEITNAQWAAFVKATGYKTVAEKKPDPKDFPQIPAKEIRKLPPFSLVFTPPAFPLKDLSDHTKWWSIVNGADWRHPTGPKSSIAKKMNHPVTQICWLDAVAYCKWRSKKDKVICRLPTEAEWEFAARGGLHRKKFPWGDKLKPKGKWMCNIWQGKFPNRNTKEDGYALTAPVGTFPPNGYGLYDMAGNVWEWCGDWYNDDYYKNSPKRNPTGPKKAGAGEPKRVQRGGSFLCDPSYCERYLTYARGKGEITSTANHIGFRCVVIPKMTAKKK